MTVTIKHETDAPQDITEKLVAVFGDKYIGSSFDGSAWAFKFAEDFVETSRAQGIIDGTESPAVAVEFAVPDDLDAPGVPKIYALALSEARDKHFHNIDYKRELTSPLFRRDFFEVPGLLTRIEWFRDEQLTDKVLVVSREYTTVPVVGITAKRTIRTWINNDGTENALAKDLGSVPYSPSGARAATKRRRENVIDSLEQDVITLLTSAGGDVQASIDLAQAFLVDLSADIDAFYKSGSIARITERLADASVLAAYPFLSTELQPGVTVGAYIVGALNY